MDVRNNFSSYITDIVSKQGGESGGKFDKGREAIEGRAKKAVSGAKKYLKHSGSLNFQALKHSQSKNLKAGLSIDGSTD